MNGTLYLVPVPIGDGDPADELAPSVLRAVGRIRDFIVENERSARRFLSRVMEQSALDESSFAILDEHTAAQDVAPLLAPLLAGRDAAIVSEAGCPCVADPGAALVAAAARAGIRSVPLAGPSSLVMALMASGLGGQRFAFSGYLPPDEAGRERAIRELEARSARDGSTQLFIETPYRNDALAATAAKVLRGETIFCAAAALATPGERVLVMKASAWRESRPAIGKVPAVFLISAGGQAAAGAEAPRAVPAAPRDRQRRIGDGGRSKARRNRP